MIFILSILVTGLTNALLGIFVFLRNTKNSINKAFFLMAAFICGWIVTLFFYYSLTDPYQVLIWGRLNFSVGIFVSFFFFAFAYLFPVRTRFLPKKLIWTLGIGTCILSIITQVTPLVDADEIIKGVEREVVYGPLYMVYMGTFIGFVISGIILQVIKVRTLRGRMRGQALYVITGFLLFFFFVLLTNFALPFYFNNYDLQPFGPVTSIFMTGLATIAIARHKLFDVRTITSRAVTYIVILSLVGFLYSGMLFIISSHFIPLSQPNLFLTAATLLTLFVGFTFRPLQQLVGKVTNSLLYKKDYNLNDVVLMLSQRMNTTLEEEIFITDILSQLQAVINSTILAVYVFKDETITDVITVPETNNPFTQIKRDDIVRLESEERILEYDEFTEMKGVKGTMQLYDMHVFVPLYIEKKFIGCLLLGPKASGEIYYSKDIALLNIFAPEFSLALKNAQSYDEIKRFNITLQEEVNRATKKLSQANEHLKELDKMKDEFLSVASHDLRTPMTAIKGYLWLMLKKIDQFPADSVEKIKRVYNSTERMIALINDMLDISRIEGGRIEIVYETFNIADIAKEVEQELSIQTEERNLHFVIETGSYIVHADRNRSHEVLVNLIGNAMKFTPNGGTIKVTFNDKGTVIATSVIDTGIGIEEKDKPKLFKKFGRIDTSNKLVTHVPGTGLGLFICKKIIELSGGEISIESEVGKGSTFTFTLPKGDSHV